MCFPHVIGRVPIWDVDRRKSPKPPEFATNPPKLKSHSLAEVRCRKSPPFASERRSISETPQLFSSAWPIPPTLDAGANPSVAVPYLAPHAGRRIGIRCVIAIVAVWIVVRRCQCAADGAAPSAKPPRPQPQPPCHACAGDELASAAPARVAAATRAVTVVLMTSPYVSLAIPDCDGCS